MDWWFLVIYLEWAAQTVKMETIGPEPTAALCQRKQGAINLPPRTELIDITPCFKTYRRERG